MKPKYEIMIPKIQNKSLKLNYFYGFLVYIALVIGLNIFVIPNINRRNVCYDALKYAFTFGVIAYGIYDFTCASLFEDWDIMLSIMDVLWGGSLYFLTIIIADKLNILF